MSNDRALRAALAKALREHHATIAHADFSGVPLDDFVASVAAALAGSGRPLREQEAYDAGRLAGYEDALAGSGPWEPPMDARCPNCGYPFRFSDTDTYRNHRCPLAGSGPEAQCRGYAGDPGASAPRCESYEGHPGDHFIRQVAGSGPEAGLRVGRITTGRVLWPASANWSSGKREVIVELAPIVDGLCSGCGTKPTRETGSCRCLHGITERLAATPAASPTDPTRKPLVNGPRYGGFMPVGDERTPGEAASPTATGHVHSGRWCQPCVNHGRNLSDMEYDAEATRAASPTATGEDTP